MQWVEANASTAKPYLPTNAIWSATPGTTPNPDGTISGRSFFETLLRKSFLENGEPSTVFMSLGEAPISQRGYDSVTWARLNPMKLSISDATLTEWVTPDSSDNIVSTITVEPVLLGAYTRFTDKLSMETLFDVIPAQGRELYNNAKRIIDEQIQKVLEEDNSVPVIYAGTATARDELTAADTIDLDLVLNGTTFLASQGATTERFKAVFHPNVFLNFAQSSSTNTWLNKTIYENFKGIEDGYITSILNFDIYVSANVKPFYVDPDGEGQEADGDEFNVYPTYIFRKGAYGTTSLKDLQTYFKPYGSGGTEDPLDQRATIGWKAYFGCAVLNPFFLVRIESRATTDYEWQKKLGE